jgi:hypothetical protein
LSCPDDVNHILLGVDHLLFTCPRFWRNAMAELSGHGLVILPKILSATHGRMRVLDIRSPGGTSRVRLPTLELSAGDLILVQDTVENLKEFESVLKAKLHSAELDAREPDDQQAPEPQAQRKVRGAEDGAAGTSPGESVRRRPRPSRRGRTRPIPT